MTRVGQMQSRKSGTRQLPGWPNTAEIIRSKAVLHMGRIATVFCYLIRWQHALVNCINGAISSEVAAQSREVHIGSSSSYMQGFKGMRIMCRNTYSALSALAGHYNSFGPETNVPKKRLDRLTKVGLREKPAHARTADRSGWHYLR